MKKLEQLYEGKAKKVFKTDDPELYIVDYKDDATALNGLKRGTIAADVLIIDLGVGFLDTVELIVFLDQGLQFVDVHKNAVGGLPVLVALFQYADDGGLHLQVFALGVALAVILVAGSVEDQLILHDVHKGVGDLAAGVGIGVPGSLHQGLSEP